MNPLEFTDAGDKFKKVDPKFVRASAVNKVEYFTHPSKYQSWMEKHPNVNIVSVINVNDNIVLTYKEM